MTYQEMLINFILTFNLSDQHTVVLRPESLALRNSSKRETLGLHALHRFGRTNFVLSSAGCMLVFARSSLLSTFLSRNPDMDTLHRICIRHVFGLTSYSLG